MECEFFVPNSNNHDFSNSQARPHGLIHPFLFLATRCQRRDNDEGLLYFQPLIIITFL
jgi:hypothetical protein